MKKIILSLIAVAMIMAMTGCGSSKGFTYVENIDSTSLAASRGLFDARIMPKDELTITVNTTNPEAAAPFNLQGGMPKAVMGLLQPMVLDIPCNQEALLRHLRYERLSCHL